MAEKATSKTLKHYLWFYIGQLFSMLGSQIVNFTIVWWITIETQNPVYLSLSTFLMFLPQVIITPFAGVLVDKINRKYIIFMVDALQAAIIFGLFNLFLLDSINIWLVLTANTLRAVLFAFQVPAFFAIVPSMVPKENLSRINGANFLLSGLITMVGPVLAATLLSFFRIEHIFLVDIFTFIIAMIPLFMIKIPTIIREKDTFRKKSFLKEFREGFTIIKAIPGLMAMICFAMIFNLLNRPYWIFLPYFINITHDGNALDLALILASVQFANFMGSGITMIKKEWKNKIKINLFGAALHFGGQLFIVFAPYRNFLFMILGLLPGALIFPITISTYLTILQSRVPQDKIGRVMSIDHTISMAIAPIGALACAPLAEIIGVSTLILIAAILGIIYPFLLGGFTKILQLDKKLPLESVEVIESQIEAAEMAESAK